MPIYEYELVEDRCLMCPGRFQVLQGVNEEPLKYCPCCGLPVRRVISSVNIKTRPAATAERAAKKGLTTFKRVAEGKWEKVAGPGVDGIVGTPKDVAAVKAERKKRPRLNLT